MSVPRADYVAGLAEVVKAGFIADPAILDLIEANPADAATPTGAHTAELVARAVAVKAAVVGADLRENAAVGPSGLGREILELRPHARARDREARGVPVAAR